jgi:hypothetical protein
MLKRVTVFPVEIVLTSGSDPRRPMIITLLTPDIVLLPLIDAILLS